MSIKSMEGNMDFASNPSLAALFKKSNELIQEANENFQSILKMQNRLTLIEKELRDMKVRLMNIG